MAAGLPSKEDAKPGLVRGLGAPMAMAVVVGCVIGSGIFRKPQIIAEALPRFDLVAAVWIAGGLLALLGSLTIAEVAVLYPRAGGNYVFLREGYGRWAGFLWGWVEFLIIKTASQAALATFFTEAFHTLLRETIGAGQATDVLSVWQRIWLTVAVILFPALVNIRGVRWGGGLQLIITLVKVGSLLAIMLIPWIFLALAQIPSTPIPTEVVGLFMQLSTGDFPAGLPVASAVQDIGLAVQANDLAHPRPGISLANFLSALVGVLFAYHGWMNLAPVAGEIRNPQRNIPIGFLGGVIVVVILYLGANIAYYRVLPEWEIPMMKDPSVAHVFSVRMIGSAGGIAMSLAIMFSTFGALNGNLLTAPRLLYAMGEDGLAPRALGAVHPRFHTPVMAILVMALWTILLVLSVAVLTEFNILDKRKAHFDMLTDFAMFGAIVFETLALSTIFVFRWRMPDAPRPYRCWGYPFVPILYMILPALMIGNMFMVEEQRKEALVGVGFMLVGAVVYWLFGRRTQPSQT